MGISIEKLSQDTLHPLHCQYAGQTTPQSAFIYLNLEERTVHAAYDSNIGGSLDSLVLKNRACRFFVSPDLTCHEINKIMEENETSFSALCNLYDAGEFQTDSDFYLGAELADITTEGAGVFEYAEEFFGVGGIPATVKEAREWALAADATVYGIEELVAETTGRSSND